jgi:hypothetical protein
MSRPQPNYYFLAQKSKAKSPVNSVAERFEKCKSGPNFVVRSRAARPPNVMEKFYERDVDQHA